MTTFQQHMSEKHKGFGINIYKPIDENGNTYDVTVYFFVDLG
jgi:hypothetical protein